MKEIIVIKKHELYTLLDCLPMPMITDEDLEKEIKEGRKIVLFGKERKAEKVPESWEELKELCEELEGKNVFIINAGNCIEFNGLYFWKDGSITTTQNNNDIWATKTNLTPARQWNIIKSLIGEE